MSKKCAKKCVSLAVAASLLLQAILFGMSGEVLAASKKAKLNKKKVTIGVGETYAIGLKNKQKKAKYTYKSSKKKVATVSKAGKVKGIKKGTANVTVQQKLKKKTTRVGVLKVTVTARKVEDDKATQKPESTPVQTPVTTPTATATATATIAPTSATPSPATATPTPPLVTMPPAPTATATPTPTPPVTVTPTPTTTPEATDGPVIQESFETGRGGFTLMGPVTTNIVDGGKEGNCIEISGRTEDWQGIDYNLSNRLEIGEEYALSSWVRQDTGAPVLVKVTLWEGEEGVGYTQLVQTEVPSGEWTELAGTIVLTEAMPAPKFYFEAAGTVDFCVDEVVVTGKKVDTGDPEPFEKVPFEYEGLDKDWVEANIDKTKPVVAFTFDDGPIGTAETSTSMQIQRALTDHGAHATFFYWGSRINAGNEAEITMAKDAGFEIGNHTWTHPNLGSAPAATILDQVGRLNEKLTELTGYSNFLFRPPYLAAGGLVTSYVNAPLINASRDTQDWNNATKDQILTTLKNAQDGDFILMHANYQTTATAVKEALEYYDEQGIQVVSVSELFYIKGRQLTTGTLYQSRVTSPTN